MPRLPDLSQHSAKELLRLHASVIDELKLRRVVRTKNNPVGDYAEWLVSKTLQLKLAGKSVRGYDATDADGTRFQIKGRRVTPDNPSRQLSAIRNLDAGDFDVLIALIFDAEFNVTEAVQVPHEVVVKYATYRKHTNAYVLHLRGEVLEDPRVQRIPALAPKT